MPKPKLTNEILTAAIDGYEAQKIRIDGKIAELRAMLPAGPGQFGTPEPIKRNRRKMSAAARARIAAAQRKRWAASKKAAKPSEPEAAPKPKRKLSAPGRAAIIAPTKKRWAQKRAEAAKTRKKKLAKKTAGKLLQGSETVNP
jgi:hypothetical protein